MNPAAAAGPLPVSVVIPVYNGERFVTETVRSVLSQTERGFEIVAVNDGSTDGSLAVLEGLRDSAGGRIRILSVPNGGVSRARNAGVAAARGTWIAFIDQDDLWTPEKLERQLALHRGRPGPLVTFTNEAVIDGNGAVIGGRVLSLGAKNRGQVFEELLFDNFIPVSSVMLDRALFDRIGGFDPAYSLAEDFDLLLRAADCAPFDFIDEPLLLYRQHPESGTFRKIERLKRESFAILSAWEKRRPGVFRRNRARHLVFRLRFFFLGLKVRAARVFGTE